jgi:hypothetical protein
VGFVIGITQGWMMKETHLDVDDSSYLRANFDTKKQYEKKTNSSSSIAWQFWEEQYGTTGTLKDVLMPAINQSDLFPYIDKEESELRKISQANFNGYTNNKEILGIVRGALVNLTEEANALTKRLNIIYNDINQVDKYRILESNEDLVNPNRFHIKQFVVMLATGVVLFFLEWIVQAVFKQSSGDPEYRGVVGIGKSMAVTSIALFGSLGLKVAFDFNRKTPKKIISILLVISLFFYFVFMSLYCGTSTVMDEMIISFNWVLSTGMMFFQMLVNTFSFVLVSVFVKKSAVHFKEEKAVYSEEYLLLQAEASSLEAQRRDKNVKKGYLTEIEAGFFDKRRHYEDLFLLAVDELRIQQFAFLSQAKSHFVSSYYSIRNDNFIKSVDSKKSIDFN